MFLARQLAATSGVPVQRLRSDLRDGTVVLATILGENEQIEVFTGAYLKGRQPPRKLRRYLAKFTAVPVSATHGGGYDPQGQGNVVHTWEDWPDATPPPYPYGSAPPAGRGQLLPTSEFDTDVTPGHLTWYSDNFRLNNDMLILSWQGPGWRHGRYGTKGGWYSSRYELPLTPEDMSSGEEGPGATDDAHFSPEQQGLNSIVWFNGEPVRVSQTVWAAGLRTVPDEGTFLYVMDQYSIYRAPINWKESIDGKERLKLPKAELVLEHVADVGLEFNTYAEGWRYTLTQMPYFNASCTKAAYLVVQQTNQLYPPTAMSGPVWRRSVLFEVTLDTGAAAEILRGTTKLYNLGQSQSRTGSESNDYAGNYSLSVSRTDVDNGRYYETVHVLAADYVGDTLDWVYAETVDAWNGRTTTTSITATIDTDITDVTSGNIRTYSMNQTWSWAHTNTETSYPNAAEPDTRVLVASHLHGELFARTYPGNIGETGSFSTSGSGSYAEETVWDVSTSPATVLSHTESGVLAADGVGSYSYFSSSNYVWMPEAATYPRLLDADLRTRSYCIQVDASGREEIGTLSNTSDLKYFGDNPPKTYDTYARQHWHYERDAVVIAFGERIHESLGQEVYEFTTYDESGTVVPGLYNPILPGAGLANGSYTDPPSVIDYLHPNSCLSQPDKYLFWVDTPYWTNALYSLIHPKYAHMAFAPEQEVGYIGVEFPEMAESPAERVEVFVARNDSGGVDVYPVKDWYAPGDNNTLSRAVFSPEGDVGGVEFDTN